jgi:hypothetical protein
VTSGTGWFWSTVHSTPRSASSAIFCRSEALALSGSARASRRYLTARSWFLSLMLEASVPSSRLRWRLLSARIVIPTRFHPIEASTMGPTRNYDKGQKGEQCKYPSHGINSLLRVPQC